MKGLGAIAGVVLAATLLLIPATDAATIQATYQARYGPYGTITVRQFTDGTGKAILNMYAMAPGRTYAFSLARGRCTTSITTLVRPGTLKVNAAGKMARTWTFSTSQMRTIGPSLSSGKLVAILTSGSSRLCRTLYVVTAFPPGPSPSPKPSPTATPTAGVTANVSAHRYGYGPLLTPSSMADWFPALKVGVAASATATVAAGQNVYALLVVPPGGSVTFRITSSSGNGGWYWEWDPQYNYWDTPEHYFYEGQFFTLNAGTTWAYGLDYNTYAGSETLTITPTAITRP